MAAWLTGTAQHGYSDQRVSLQHLSWQTLLGLTTATPTMPRKEYLSDIAVTVGSFGHGMEGLFLHASFTIGTTLDAVRYYDLAWYNLKCMLIGLGGMTSV